MARTKPPIGRWAFPGFTPTVGQHPVSLTLPPAHLAPPGSFPQGKMKENGGSWRRAGMRRNRSNIAFLICVVAGASAAAWGQVPKTAKQKPGGLDGEVVNAKGAPVAGAQILWQVADGETPHVLHSDAQGRFH